jgi:hypothetical protein
MKLYYAIAILARLLVASLTGNESQKAYMLYLWGDLFDREQPSEKASRTRSWLALFDLFEI